MRRHCELGICIIYVEVLPNRCLKPSLLVVVFKLRRHFLPKISFLLWRLKKISPSTVWYLLLLLEVIGQHQTCYIFQRRSAKWFELWLVKTQWELLSISHLILRAMCRQRVPASVEANHRGCVIRPPAGEAVLDDAAEVTLPANCIHNHHQGTVPHQMTHHGLLLVAGEEWHPNTFVYWSLFHNM